ncbi:MAG: response regulator [Bryobacterales bacterium]|nr:response regulator [Bryobacterales bacterium]
MGLEAEASERFHGVGPTAFAEHLGAPKAARPILAFKIALPLIGLASGAWLGLAAFAEFLRQTASDVPFLSVAARQRLLGEEIYRYVHRLALGQRGDRHGLAACIKEFDEALDVLERGGRSIGVELSAAPVELRDEVAEVRRAWQQLRGPLQEALHVPAYDESAWQRIREVERLVPALNLSTSRLVAAYMARAQELRQRALWKLALAASASTLLLLVGLWGACRYLIRPVRLIEEGIRHIQHGNFSHRVPIVTRDELAVVAESFNAMAERLGAMLEAAREGEKRFRALFEDAPVAYHEIDHEGRVRHVNRAECALLGLEPSAMLGRPIWEFVTPEQRSLSQEAVRKKLSGQLPLVPIQREYVRADGSRVTVEIHESLIRDATGTIVGIRSVMLDITARKQAEQALLEAKEAAEAAARAKSQFLANMSHEIRTPLNGVLGMTSLLLDTPLTPEQRRFVEVLRSSGEALLAVVNQILDFSKAEAGKLTLEAVPFDLETVIDAAAELVAPQAQAKNLELCTYVAPSVPTKLQGDPERLRQVLVNLVGNAVKFTERGEVVIQVTCEEDRPDEATLRFSVRDTGIGLPPGAERWLFQPFTQADGSAARKYGGVGLGLALSKQLVELMGGRIGARGEPGRGSAFWFTARFAKPAPPEDAVAPPAETLEGLRVLLVEDHETTRAILERYLASWGVSFRRASGTRETLEAMRRAAAEGEPYDAVLVSRRLLDSEGTALSQAIEADAQLGNVALILLVAWRDLCDRGMANHAVRCLVKPVKRKQLFECLASVKNPRAPAQAVLPAKAAPETLPRPAPRNRAGRGAHILVVEDNAVNQMVLLQMLAKLGCTTEAVANGLEAVEAASRGRYDLILMDCQMPEMDGFEATARIRQREQADGRPRTPIVAVTAHALPEDRERCLQAGMDDYLSKPISPLSLAEVLARWTEPASPSGSAAEASPLPAAQP